MKNKYTVCQRGLGEVQKCPVTGESLPTDLPYAIFNEGRRQLSPKAARDLAPPKLFTILETANASIGGVSSDEKQIGIMDASARNFGTICPLAIQRFGRGNVPIDDRGQYVLGCGLRQGETPLAISIAAGDRLAPALSAVLHKYYGTTPGPKLESASEQAAREQQEAEAQAEADREHAAIAAARSKQARREQFIADISAIMAVDVERVEKLLTTIQAYFGLTTP